jgi:methenyltetrahydrofolate cyclohydrolase
MEDIIENKNGKVSLEYGRKQMLVNQTVREFVDIVASDAPAPGGGSVAALAGAMAAGLVVMVCNLTLGRPKYAVVEQELLGVKSRAEVMQQQLLELVDRDTESFNKVMTAYRLPKACEEETLFRSRAIQATSQEAAQVPLQTAELCWEVLQITDNLVSKANPNAITDMGVAANISETGLQGAVYNVLINLGSIKDEEFCMRARQRCQDLVAQARVVLARVGRAVEDNL